jgi:DNA-binding NtrC family response regulator
LREGTTVQIYLPRAQEAAASAVDRVRLADTARGAHILVVDDDSDVRWIIAQDLQAMGCIVTEAESGRAALAILERNPPCDLMVTDLVMPGLSGLDTLRLAHRSRPDLKVLFTSGYADLSRFGDNLRNHPLLRKPFKPETLAEAVQTALHGYPGEPHNVVPLQRDRR